MPERETHDPDPALAKSGPLPTPRVSGEPSGSLRALVGPDSSGPQASPSPMTVPESSTRAFELRSVVPPEEHTPSAAPSLPVPSEPSDTLLSAGKPADKLEIMLEDRLAQVDERLRELEGRLVILEQKKTSLAPAAEARHKPWLWLAFLVALVVVFQLLRHVR